MGKKIKKGTKGEVTKFCTRSQALKKLQLKLRDFRRLCILKGIFPKEPKKKFKGVNKTYYYLKDIQYLANESLLKKFRDITVWEKKIKRAKNRSEEYNMKKLIENKPTYTIDHILRERYPRFTDALNDLDDALCLISLFANLPKHDLLGINTETISLCKRLLKEFNFYVSISKILKKSFISIKGIYMSAEIMGNEIVWLVPFNFPQKLTFEVDYSIMLSFLELYTNLLKFVNFKLFKDVGIEYPVFPENSDLPNYGYDSLGIRQIQTQIHDKNIENSNETKNKLNVESVEMQKILEKEQQTATLKNLFKNFNFFICREVPKDVFSLAILSCGGLYGDESDNSPFDYNDKRITHYIIDRKPEFIEFKKNKEFVQPQWIFDCINSGKLLPIADYEPGKSLPPHLSPFFEYDSKDYKLKLNKQTNEEEDREEEQVVQNDDEPKDLREMLVSNKKKKILEKLRKERTKTTKLPKINN